MIAILESQIFRASTWAVTSGLLVWIAILVIGLPRKIEAAIKHKVVIHQSDKKDLDPKAIKRRREELLAEARDGG